MNLFNIGGEGQLYAGAIARRGRRHRDRQPPWPLSIPAMILAGAAGGAALGADPGVLRAFFSTNEIITSLMLKYVVALVISLPDLRLGVVLARHLEPDGEGVPAGEDLPDAASWPVSHVGSLVLPFGFLLGVVIAAGIWLLYTRTRFGFEVQVIGDSPRAGELRGHAHAAEDPRRDGALGAVAGSAAPRRTATSATRSTRAG